MSQIFTKLVLYTGKINGELLVTHLHWKPEEDVSNIIQGMSLKNYRWTFQQECEGKQAKNKQFLSSMFFYIGGKQKVLSTFKGCLSDILQRLTIKTPYRSLYLLAFWLNLYLDKFTTRVNDYTIFVSLFCTCYS